MSDHTPGPWGWKQYHNCLELYGNADREYLGALACNVATARLMAEAPNLLAVLETTTAMLLFEAVSLEERGEPDKAIPIRGQVALARAVIKKATEE